MSTDEVATLDVHVDRNSREARDSTIVDLDALSALALLDLAPYLPVLGEAYEPICLEAVRAKLLLENLLKKYEHDNSEVADAAALDKFLAVNRLCGTYEVGELSKDDEVLLGEFKNLLWRFFYPAQAGDCVLSSFEQILAHGMTGPGASRGATADDFYSKMFASPLTFTSQSLYDVYRRYVGRQDAWRDAELYRYSVYGHLDRVLDSNKLCFVPKKVDVSRCIAVEPSLNMFYQLGVKRILEKRLKSFFGIDLSTQQEKNRDLAQLGSMFEGSWATIDLSSASDSLSLRMLRKFLPKEPLGFLEALRSPYMELPPEMGGGRVALEMISTMGNGYTFPLQTILFACIVVAAHRTHSLRLDRPSGPPDRRHEGNPLCRAEVAVEYPRGHSIGNFGVYGDDIVCRTEVLPSVLRLLDLLGFRVNGDKSFLEGPFRESCGGDFWKGHYVRPVFITSLRSPQELYVALNQLNRWTAMSGIALPLTAAFIRSHLDARSELLVPPAEQDDSGLKAPLSAVLHLKRDPHIQAVKYCRWEVRVKRMHATLCGVYSRTSSGSWREAAFFNPHGLWVAFLGGYVRGSEIGARLRTKSYRRSRRVVPSWDYVPTVGVAPTEWTSIAFEQAYKSNEAYLGLVRRA